MRTGHDDGVAVGITQPAFIVGVLTATARFDDLSLQFLGTRNRAVEVVKLKPQEHAVSVWLKIPVPDGTVAVLHIPSVQLKDQPVV